MALIDDGLILALPSGLVTLLKALGWAILFYIAFNIVNLFMNRKKGKELAKINENLDDIKKLLENQNKSKKKK